MNFIKNLLHRVCLQRRRHRNIFMAASVFLSLVLFFFLFGWPENIRDDFMYIRGLEGPCSYLPRFTCNWKPITDVFVEDQLFDTSAPLESEETSSVSKANEENPESIENSYSQDDLEKIKYIKSTITAAESTRLKLAHKFYKTVFEDIIKAEPSIQNKLEKFLNDKVCPTERYADDKHEPLFSEEFLSSFLQLTEAEIQALSASHNFIKERLPEKAPRGLYKGNGIVYVGGGKFSWLTLLSIKGLRGNGCKLPIEILIPSLEEYDLHICSKALAMNAKCIYLPTELGGKDSKLAPSLNIKGYQLKALAILLSSFENVLLLDSDNISAHSPDFLFNNEPFLSRGFVVWPDFWRRSISPSFYQIAGEEISQSELLPKYYEHFGFYQQQPITEKLNMVKDLSYHERKGAIPDPSSEAGQLMVSKKSHLKAVILALYYNTYGPKFYYPLFSQGALGEGDKETFLAATVILRKSFYQVGRFVTAVGNVKHDVFTGHAMGQHDPVEDYRLSKQKSKLSTHLKGKELENELDKIGSPRMLFLHANFPKLDPWALKEAGETLDKDGRHRLYGNGMKKSTGKDLEMDIWRHMDTILCQERLQVDHFKDIDRGDLCEEIGAQIKHLADTVNMLE